MISPPSVNVLSPDSVASSMDLSPNSPFSPYAASHQIDYKVYPKDVQDLASEFTQLCSQYHRLGMLLSGHFRHADAKREYSRALKCFRNLKVKPRLYHEILAEIKKHGITTPTTGNERAKRIAKQQKTPSMRGHNSNRAPNSPSISFRFPDKGPMDVVDELRGDVSPFRDLFVTAQ